MRLFKCKGDKVLKKELKGDFNFFMKEANNNKNSKGYGLSYSDFTYCDLKISSKKMNKDSTITVTVKVKNNNNIGGKEVIQLYNKNIV